RCFCGRVVRRKLKKLPKLTLSVLSKEVISASLSDSAGNSCPLPLGVIPGSVACPNTLSSPVSPSMLSFWEGKEKRFLSTSQPPGCCIFPPLRPKLLSAAEVPNSFEGIPLLPNSKPFTGLLFTFWMLVAALSPSCLHVEAVVVGTVLAKAIHSLSRIGDELYVEPQEDGLALRSVNSSRSAYACFLFAPLFFSRYTVHTGHTFRCKMAIKSVQAVFRSLASLEKTVEKCHIELDDQNNRLTFTLHCKHGLMKTHNLSFQDSESLQAVFDKDSYANVFRSHPRLLVDTVMHFPPSLEEVTVSVSDERMWVRNHVEEEGDQSKAMLTELCLASDEFDHFAVQAHNSVTFCLKELRGLLVFAESTGLPISMYFDEPGRAHTPPLPPPDDFMNDDIDSYLIAMDTSVAPGPSATGPPTPPFADSICSKQTAAASHRTRLHSEEEEEEETTSSGRPPNKKFCSLFFGSVLPPSSQISTQPVSSQQVLASDSEDDVHSFSLFFLNLSSSFSLLSRTLRLILLSLELSFSSPSSSTCFPVPDPSLKS
ncbi:hypothetical protein FQN60_010229, partial [Etheostoma spectabile]